MTVTLIECKNLMNSNSEGTAWPISYLLGNIAALKNPFKYITWFYGSKTINLKIFITLLQYTSI